MLLNACFFLFGVVWLQTFAALPSLYWCALFVPILLWIFWQRSIQAPTMAAMGFLWALGYAHWVLLGTLPSELEGQNIRVEGRVISLPQRQGRALRFLFSVDHWLDAGEASLRPMRIRLSWYAQKTPLQAGERWRFTVRLKQPYGFRNPGGFDYEGWLFQQGIRATGYIVDKQPHKRLQQAAPWSISHWREQVEQRLHAQLAMHSSAPFLKALAVGERKDIRPDQWEVLRRTGTNHLVAISGLHIGMVAGLVFFLVRWGWSRWSRLVEYWPAPKAGILGAMVMATVYAALAGFSLPTQRALLMLLVVAGATLLQRQLRYGHGLALALVLVLLADPLAVLSISFWLSFTAVALILYALTGRVVGGSWSLRLFRTQWVISLGLAPLLIAYFQQVSLLAPLVNLLAIPWISMVVVPLVLLGTLVLPWPALAAPLFFLANSAMNLLWLLLVWVASLPWGQWIQGQPPIWTLWSAGLGILLLLAPRGLPGRVLGLLFLLPLLVLRPNPPEHGEVRFSLLDVGQGLAAVVQTRNHVLVYDTGPRFSDRFDAGAAVLAPFLRSEGIAHIDKLVVSHGDNDHIGGVASLLQVLPAHQILSSVPTHKKLQGFVARRCRAGQRWQWDGVVFQVLHPTDETLWRGNNASCVLRITTWNKALLLTGDIELPAERALLQNQRDFLAADVLVAPHHGSASSSSVPFIKAVAPSYVLFPVGYRNRWNFPRENVVARYHKQGVAQLETAQYGAIRFVLDQNPLAPPETYRQRHSRYWQNHVLSKTR